jgi:hypothetical protein
MHTQTCFTLQTEDSTALPFHVSLHITVHNPLTAQVSVRVDRTRGHGHSIGKALLVDGAGRTASGCGEYSDYIQDSLGYLQALAHGMEQDIASALYLDSLDDTSMRFQRGQISSEICRLAVGWLCQPLDVVRV